MLHFERFLAHGLKAEWHRLDGLLEDGFFGEDDLVAELRANRLGGWLAACLNSVDARTARQQSLLNHLRSDFVRQWMAAEDNLRRLAALADSLGNRFSEVVVLKGPLLAARFWGATEYRETRDIDLLVPKPRLAEFRAHLRGAGFAGLHSSRLLYSLFMYHYDLQHSDGSVVELHWELRRHLGCFRIDYPRLFERTESLSLEGRSYRVLSLDYELTFQALIAFNDFVFGKNTWREVVDLYTVLRRAEETLDWPMFFQEKRDEKLLGILFNTIDLVLSRLQLRRDFPRFYQEAEKGILLGGSVRTSRSVPREEWIYGSYACSLPRRRLWLLIAKYWEEGSRLMLPLKNAKRRFHRARTARAPGGCAV